MSLQGYASSAEIHGRYCGSDLNLPLRSSLYAVFPMHSITLKGPTNLALSFLVPARWRVFEESSTSSPTRCSYSLWCLLKYSASGSLVLSSGDSWRPGLAAGCAARSELHQASYSSFPQ